MFGLFARPGAFSIRDTAFTLTVLAATQLLSCQTQNVNPQLDVTQPTSAPSPTLAVDAKGEGEAEKEEQGKAPEGQPVAATSSEEGQTESEGPVKATNSVSDNVDAVLGLMREFGSKNRVTDFPPNDPRRKTDELYLKYDGARQALLRLYRDKDLPPEDSRNLCKAFSQFGLDYAEEAIHFCEAYLAGQTLAPDDQDHQRAMWTLARSYHSLKKVAKAEKVLRDYLDLFCNLEQETKKTSMGFGCKQILTQYLPEIYHQSGNVDGLLAVLDECWAYHFESDRDLRRLRQYLLEDLWDKKDLARLEKLAREVLAKDVWGEGKRYAPNRSLVGPALSALARVVLINKGCIAARQVYLDYEFEQPEIDRTWLQDNIQAPSRLICRPAPSIVVKNWVNGKAPTVLPGKGPSDKVILLHLVDPAVASSITTLSTVSDLATRKTDQLQAITLIPFSEKLFDPVQKKLETGLGAENFGERIAKIIEELSVTQPVGILEGGLNDAVLSQFQLQRLPTWILIGRDGNVAAFHPLATADSGWELVVDAVAAK